MQAGCIRVSPLSARGLISSLGERETGGKGEGFKSAIHKRTMRRSLFIARAVYSPFNLQEINTGRAETTKLYPTGRKDGAKGNERDRGEGERARKSAERSGGKKREVEGGNAQK